MIKSSNTCGEHMHTATMKAFLDAKADQYNRPSFIENDPIAVPHSYLKQQDIEIAAFYAAIFAWGQRKTTIRKCRELLTMMDNAPHDFILHHRPSDRKPLGRFRHRTFQTIDLLYSIDFLQWHYQRHKTLESAFYQGMSLQETTIEKGLVQFHEQFFMLRNAPVRTRKHIATPKRRSACKRLNMFLRWMVRKDRQGVDLGLWQRIKPHQLVCPCDVHVGRVARKLGLLTRNATDWKAAMELTQNLRALCPTDPVKYDFALFGLGIFEQF